MRKKPKDQASAVVRAPLPVSRRRVSVGRIYVSPLSGVLSESIGWPNFFLFSVVMGAPGLFMVWGMRDTLRRLTGSGTRATADA